MFFYGIYLYNQNYNVYAKKLKFNPKRFRQNKNKKMEHALSTCIR